MLDLGNFKEFNADRAKMCLLEVFLTLGSVRPDAFLQKKLSSLLFPRLTVNGDQCLLRPQWHFVSLTINKLFSTLKVPENEEIGN